LNADIPAAEAEFRLAELSRPRGDFFLAAALRILPEFAAICRPKPLISFRINT